MSYYMFCLSYVVIEAEAGHFFLEKRTGATV